MARSILPLACGEGGDEVVDAERPAHAPELRLDVLALVPEHGEGVGVDRLRQPVSEERLLQHREVLGYELALAHPARHHLARGVVERDDDLLARVPRPPDVARRGVVLVQLAVSLAFPPPERLRPARALEREHGLHQRHEVPHAVLPDVGTVAAESELARQLVRVQPEVGPVVARRLDERAQMGDAFGRPLLGVVAAGHAKEHRGLAAVQPLRPQTVDLGLAELQEIHRLAQADLPVVEPRDYLGYGMRSQPRV